MSEIEVNHPDYDELMSFLRDEFARVQGRQCVGVDVVIGPDGGESDKLIRRWERLEQPELFELQDGLLRNNLLATEIIAVAKNELDNKPGRHRFAVRTHQHLGSRRVRSFWIGTDGDDRAAPTASTSAKVDQLLAILENASFDVTDPAKREWERAATALKWLDGEIGPLASALSMQIKGGRSRAVVQGERDPAVIEEARQRGVCCTCVLCGLGEAWIVPGDHRRVTFELSCGHQLVVEGRDPPRVADAQPDQFVGWTPPSMRLGREQAPRRLLWEFASELAVPPGHTVSLTFRPQQYSVRITNILVRRREGFSITAISIGNRPQLQAAMSADALLGDFAYETLDIVETSMDLVIEARYDGPEPGLQLVVAVFYQESL